MIARQFALLLTLLMLAVPGLAQQGQTPTTKDQNGCKIYNPMPQDDETVKWSGACRDGYANGKGVLEWFKGGRLEERYEGEMKDGWAEGQGTFTSSQGMRYEGEWKRSKQDGQGTSQSPDGGVYKGEWRDGKPNGWGTYTSPSGESVTGEWEDGELKSATGSQRI